jgi:hypothetical protein
MKTPIQCLIEDIKLKIETNNFITDDAKKFGLSDFLEVLKRYESIERMTIEIAYDSAKVYPSADCTGSKYYFMNYITND